MEDFKNSVAHLDVDVATAVSISSVVGDNFYKFLYVTNETGTSLDTATTPLLITSDTYSDVVDSLGVSASKTALIKKNLASVFDYASGIQGYIISVSKYVDFKCYAYWCYLETEYEVDDSGADPVLQFTSNTEALFSAINTNKDEAFSAYIADLAVDASASISQAPSSMVDDFLETLGSLTFKLGLFARGATSEFAWTEDDVLSLGYSPAMYQLGRTLGYTNTTGTPIGDSMDTVACAFQDVLPSRNTSTSVLINASALFINWCQNNKVAYFKTLGNGTAQVVCYGGWSLKGTSLVADWIVAYVNYMTKVSCAEIITGMNVYKTAQTYNKCISAMSGNMAPFIALGRIYNYKETAPSWAEAQRLSDRETITIPHAWEAWFVDDVRKVKIQGSLTI